jgi:hypothetical protein
VEVVQPDGAVALQDVALVELQVKVELPPGEIVVGLAERETEGTATVTVAED